MLNDHLEEWFGLPVEAATADTEFEPGTKVYRFEFSYDNEDEDPRETLAAFLDLPGVEKTVAIILGNADEGGSDTTYDPFLDLLEQHKDRLPNLRGLFLGDVTQEENEMSWIKQCDIARALRIFPGLEELRSGGQDGLGFTACRHIGLTKLIISTGGMPKEVLEGIAGSVFPELEHLELWLGTEYYGLTATIEDVTALLNPALFPKLKHLALGNCDFQNEIAAAVADAPLLDQLESLDLSMGTMTDEGAQPLLSSARVKKLKHLNLHRNYLSVTVAAQFQSLGISVDVGGQETPSTYGGETSYYVAVGE